MPYPTPDHRDYCPGSRQAAPAPDPEKIWLRCPQCRRLIATMADGCFYPHLNHPTRRNDAIQELLDAHGANRRTRRQPLRYADPEPDLTPPSPTAT